MVSTAPDMDNKSQNERESTPKHQKFIEIFENSLFNYFFLENGKHEKIFYLVSCN